MACWALDSLRFRPAAFPGGANDHSGDTVPQCESGAGGEDVMSAGGGDDRMALDGGGMRLASVGRPSCGSDAGMVASDESSSSSGNLDESAFLAGWYGADWV